MSADSYAHLRFSRIQTWGRLPDGRVITGWYSYPRGVGKDVYDRIDASLVRAFGNNNCRTVGTPIRNERNPGFVREGATTEPLPCLVCGKELDSAANDPAFDDVPYAGTMFHTSGHYGSTVFDSFDGYKLQIVVCDDCLSQRANTRIRLRSPSGEVVPWDGRSDTIDTPAEDD